MAVPPPPPPAGETGETKRGQHWHDTRSVTAVHSEQWLFFSETFQTMTIYQKTDSIQFFLRFLLLGNSALKYLMVK